MRKFVRRASQKISKLTNEQLNQLLEILYSENETLDSVIESLSIGLLICDVEWKLLFANKASERIIPLTIRLSDFRSSDLPQEQEVWHFIADLDIAAFITKNIDKTYANQDFTLETSGGNKRFVSISTMPLVREKKLIGNIIKIDDITEKKNAEVLLRRMESLASLTNLAASVAHEIKNPLGSISIHIQLIEKIIQKARENNNQLIDDEKIEKYLDISTEEIERLNKIIVDFLFAVRPISAHLELIDIHALLKNFLPFFEAELSEKKIQLEVSIPSGEQKLFIDEKLFKQVLINLIQNAMDVLPSGGCIKISGEIDNGNYVLFVKDDGKGISNEAIHKIFEPYFTTKLTGTGLGLTMVYKIIKEFSGDIIVSSKIGEGTVFKITIPLPQMERKYLDYTGNADEI